MAAASHDPPFTPALVGRDRELATLRAHLDAALAGRGSLVLISGEAGIGKTALAETLLAEADERGALVLVGRSYDLSETPPYGPWRELFARAPRDTDLPALPTAVLAPARGGEALGGQEAIISRVLAYLAALAGMRPLALFLDDVHWADPASLDLLRIVARDLAGLPILLIVTCRAEEVAEGQPLAVLVPLLVREARADRLALRPLDESALHALVQRYALPAGEPARLVGWLRARAEGNPLYTGELLRALEGEGLLASDAGPLGDLAAVPVPPLLRQVIAGRAARLGAEARRLLAIAAAIGPEVPLDLWAAVAGSDAGVVLDAAERAVAAHLLLESDDGSAVRFAHALIREALYAATPALRRRAWHRAAAETLMVAPRPDPDAVAAHLQRAGDPRAAEWLVRAGDRAEGAYAWISAAERLEAAMALLAGDDARAGERARLALRLADLRRYADPQASVAHAEEAGRLAAVAGDRALAALALAERGLFRNFAGDWRGGLEDLAAAVAAEEALAPGEGGPPDGRSPWRGTLLLQLAGAGRLAEAAALGEAHLAEVAPQSAGAQLGGSFAGDAWWGIARARALLGHAAEAAGAFARARSDYEAARHHALLAAIGVEELALVALTYQPERLAARRRLAVEAAGAAARAGGVGLEAPPRAAILPLLALEGHWSEARALGLAAHTGGQTFHMLATRLTLGPLARGRGEADLAWGVVRALLPGGAGTAPGEAYYDDAVAAQRLAAALATDAGDLTEARAWLAAHDRWLAWSGAVLGRAEGTLGWAAYHRAAGDLAAARVQAERALAHAGDPRQPLALLAAHRLLGELATADGRHAEAVEHLEAALLLADSCAAPYERALCLLALAESHAALGNKDGAAPLLADSRALLTDLDARPVLARAAHLAARLAAATVRPAAVPAAGAAPIDLTAREIEVLRLVAEGLTNAEVAVRLFLSPRTVARHLDNLYTKLDVTTRTAALRVASERGLL